MGLGNGACAAPRCARECAPPVTALAVTGMTSSTHPSPQATTRCRLRIAVTHAPHCSSRREAHRVSRLVVVLVGSDERSRRGHGIVFVIESCGSVRGGTEGLCFWRHRCTSSSTATISPAPRSTCTSIPSRPRARRSPNGAAVPFRLLRRSLTHAQRRRALGMDGMHQLEGRGAGRDGAGQGDQANQLQGGTDTPSPLRQT